MADKKQLKIIRESAQAWNQLRRKTDLSHPDLSGADLSATDLSAANLANTNLANANLGEADLFGADLSGAVLVGADLGRAILNKANLTRANLRSASLGAADLSHANLENADLSQSHLGAANFCGAQLRQASLNEASLSGANLFGASLVEARLMDADLTGADFGQARLARANLSRANLTGTDFTEADLTEANLQAARLNEATLIEAELSRANFAGADLRRANFNGAILTGAILRDSLLSATTFGNNDLSVAVGLEAARHSGPSTLGLGTLFLSKGKIPESFLRGAGIPQEFIRYISHLNGKLLQFHRCFISYSEEDEAFARLLHDKLQEHGVRCWLRKRHLAPGREMDQSMGARTQLWEKQILCASKSSLASWWVDDEIRRALQKEAQILKEHGKKVLALIPIDLDGSLRSASFRTGLKSEITDRIAATFAGWEKNETIFGRELERVISALRTDEEG